MSQNRWDQLNIPHKGWNCDDVIDLREDGSSVDETNYATCQMCGNEKIRYVHIMSHPNFSECLEVGCFCAEKMSNDYIGPRQREKELKNRANRRLNWLKRKWKISRQRGNPYLKLGDTHLLIFRKNTNPVSWGYKVGDHFGDGSYSSIDKAKLALFDAYENEIKNSLLSLEDELVS